ncbi:MAG TPA: DUF6152 family protein [Caulobacteraceae bacterium]|jgi:hypothetical protein|nr:DUF6152 family protein [Caulobacteraceae bacterium]
MTRRRAWLAIAGLAASAPPAWAHHSLVHYDEGRPVDLTGEVVEFSFTNPHPYIVLAVKPASGAPLTWRLEMDNLFELAEVGVKRDTLKPHDLVVVRGDPDRGGDRSLYLRRLERRSDGLLYEQVGMSPRLTLGAK